MCPPKYASIESSLFLFSVPQTCLNSPDPPPVPPSADQRMSATGYEETELTYNVNEEEQQKVVLTILFFTLVLTINVIAGAADDVLVALLVARGPAHAQLVLAHRLLLLGALSLHHPPPPTPCAFTISR